MVDKLTQMGYNVEKSGITEKKAERLRKDKTVKRKILKFILRIVDLIVFIIICCVLGVLIARRAIKKRKRSVNSFEYSHNDRF